MPTDVGTLCAAAVRAQEARKAHASGMTARMRQDFPAMACLPRLLPCRVGDASRVDLRFAYEYVCTSVGRREERVNELMPDVDELHPIPHLEKIDVAVYCKNGGSYGVVVEQPLRDDLVTRTRLLKKLENYVGDFHSDEFRNRHGEPMPGKLRIYVAIHPDTDPGILSFLEDCRPWMADNKVELIVRYLDPADDWRADGSRLLN
jgi:hypothetical protein